MRVQRGLGKTIDLPVKQEREKKKRKEILMFFGGAVFLVVFLVVFAAKAKEKQKKKMIKENKEYLFILLNNPLSTKVDSLVLDTSYLASVALALGRSLQVGDTILVREKSNPHKYKEQGEESLVVSGISELEYESDLLGRKNGSYSASDIFEIVLK